MLNLFPIQFLAPLAYTLLRLCAGALLIRIGVRRIKNRSQKKASLETKNLSTTPFVFIVIGLIEIVSGALFILGLYTQLAALLVLLISGMQVLFPRALWNPGIPSRIFYLLLFFVSLSLFITGAGILAFDLPI